MQALNLGPVMADMGVRSFAQVNSTLSQITGIPTSERTTALARLKTARDGCPTKGGDTDYALALAELKRLGAPVARGK